MSPLALWDVRWSWRDIQNVWFRCIFVYVGRCVYVWTDKKGHWLKNNVELSVNVKLTLTWKSEVWSVSLSARAGKGHDDILTRFLMQYCVISVQYHLLSCPYMKRLLFCSYSFYFLFFKVSVSAYFCWRHFSCHVRGLGAAGEISCHATESR